MERMQYRTMTYLSEPEKIQQITKMKSRNLYITSIISRGNCKFGSQNCHKQVNTCRIYESIVVTYCTKEINSLLCQVSSRGNDGSIYDLSGAWRAPQGSREVASGSGLRGGGIPESSADRKDARISEIGGRGRDEEQARLPAARRPETMRCRGRTRSVERGQKPCWSALLVFTMDGRSNGLGF